MRICLCVFILTVHLWLKWESFACAFNLRIKGNEASIRLRKIENAAIKLKEWKMTNKTTAQTKYRLKSIYAILSFFVRRFEFLHGWLFVCLASIRFGEQIGPIWYTDTMFHAGHSYNVCLSFVGNVCKMPCYSNVRRLRVYNSSKQTHWY